MKTLVIGGGSIGLAAAVVCHQAGHQVIVFDPFGFQPVEPTVEMDARVWALGPKSTGFLSDIHAWSPDALIDVFPNCLGCLTARRQHTLEA